MLEMNVYKPLIIHNVMQSIGLLTDGCANFRRFLVDGTMPDEKVIARHVERSLMLVTALAPIIGYDRASEIAHHAHENDQSLREAALELAYVTAEDFDRVVDPAKMTAPAARP
jgi:fumarate hydratase, class II